jgi:solute carrier family 12 (potassium/chloride transporters), member 9
LKFCRENGLIFCSFRSESSPYQTKQFDTAGKQAFPFREPNTKSLSAIEYVDIISDVLRMKKNICICRHFHRLDKPTIARNPHIRYIDVWPVNVFDPKNEDPFDVVSQFMMQLACIINMLKVWKNLQLRVFLCESDLVPNNHFSVSASTNSVQMERPSEYRLNQLLKLLRITAKIIQIPEWTKNVEFIRHSSILKQFTQQADNEEFMVSEENINRSKLYMQRINQIIRDHSENTAVSFLYLPSPPKATSSSYQDRAIRYLELLTELTADLPPAVLVHGINAVTSTSL